MHVISIPDAAREHDDAPYRANLVAYEVCLLVSFYDEVVARELCKPQPFSWCFDLPSFDMVPFMSQELSPDLPPKQNEGRLGPAGWITLIVLAVLLAWATWYSMHTWSALSGVTVSTAGWVFLVMGVVVTAVVGAGLMALLFYSSRKNYDR